MATSGTVNTYVYSSAKIIDHGFRRAGLLRSMASAENVVIAQDLLFSILAEWVNAGTPLWTLEYQMLGITIGSPTVNTPAGTVDVRHAYWRILNPYRGSAVGTDGTGATALFGGASNADVVIAGPNPGVIVNFGTPSEIDTVGILLGAQASFTAALNILVSTDGVTFTQAQALPSATYSPGQWVYFDLNPNLTFLAMQVQYTGGASWTLNQINFGLANGQDIELGTLNLDDYYNLPDKSFRSSQPNSYYLDRQIVAPIIDIWPTPDSNAFYNGTVTSQFRRYVQDPGLLTNSVEIPTRAIEALQWRLASRLIHEIPDDQAAQAQQSPYTAMAKQQKIQLIEQNATKSEMLFWAEERSRSPIKLSANISGYTR